MKRCPPLWFRAAWAAMLVSLLAVGVYGQGLQTGNVYGVVEANDGSALPGVTVTLSGVGAPRTTVTDAQGQFRFLNLDPGTYSLKAELAGYGTATRSGLSVNIGRNTDVTMTLNPSVTQTITVTAEAPLLDVRRTGTGATVTKVEMEAVPTGRDPWVILQQTPGVLMDRINVGGNESGQQSGYTSKGTISNQSTWNVDGVNITDVGALGSSPTYYDFDSFEEMQLTTGGTDPRIQTPGVQINMVTKRGTNDLRGSLRYFLTPGDWQSDPNIPAEANNGGSVFGPNNYLGSVNEIDNIEDYGVEAGGPIVRDRFWLWGAYSHQQIDLLTGAPVGQTRRFSDKTELETLNGKGNAQLGAANSLSIAAMVGNKIKLGRNVGPTRFPETAWNQDSAYNGPTMWKIEDTHVFGPSFYLTGLYSKVQGGFQLIADNGNGCETYECGLDSQPAYWDFTGDGAWHRSFASYVTERPQKQYRADASTFFSTGALNHELKFGLGFRDAEVLSQSAWPHDQWMLFFDDPDVHPPGTAGAQGGAYFQRPTNFTYTVEAMDVYVGDTMMWGNLTLQAGLRFDNQKGGVESGSTTANATIPDILSAISWNASDIGELEWDTISPRVGLTYTLGSQRKTLLRAAANRYVDQMGGSTVYLPAPGAYNYLYYYFTDLNGNLFIDRNEIDFATGVLAFGGVDPHNPGANDPLYRWDPDMEVPNTNEFLFGAETELLNNFTVGATVTYRELNDFIGNRAEHGRGSGNFYSAADYERNPTNATCNPATQNCGPYTSGYSLPYYRLKAGIDPAIFYVITNIPDYSQEYTGLELTAVKRMANRWMLRGNFTWSDWTQSVSDDSFADPSRLRNAFGCNHCDGGTVIVGSGTGSGAKGGVYINAEWAYNLTGAYQIPVIETTLGFNLTGRQGYPIPYIHRVTTSEGFKFLLIEDDPAETRHDDIHTLDLRLAKDLRFGGVGLTVSADVFNVLNNDNILQRNTRLGTATGNRITEIVSPRVFRFGARLTF